MSRVWLFGNDVNTDEIIAGRYNMTTDHRELAKYCLCEIRPDYPKEVKQGDVIVGGRNFGCGSSREHAPVAIKSSGAKCPELDGIEDGSDISVNLETGEIKTGNKTFHAHPLPPFIMQIIDAGGIIDFLATNSLDDLQI